ncbi:MAG TPA: MgtC/SapB family protein [Spirochaetota bacterium]|nr:MgtC/SapB family protein [Spirochaetota bacterium]
MMDSITGLDLLSPVTGLVRMLFALAAGFLIGFERERQYQPAGLRTHMVLALGACTIMILSLYIPATFIDQFANSDPARLSAQVISEIGFLGAGAIFKYGFSIRGLTTAATIWTTSGIGLVFGAGYYMLGVISTVLLVIVLQVFEKIENWLVEQRKIRILQVTFYSAEITPKQVMNVVKMFKDDIEVRQVSITEDVENKTTDVEINCRIDEDISIRQLFNSIKELGSIKTLRID